MEVQPFEMCHCRCHDLPDGCYRHLEPCCQVCPHCGLRIRKDYFRMHCIECRESVFSGESEVDSKRGDES